MLHSLTIRLTYNCISLRPSIYVMGSNVNLGSFGVTGFKRSFAPKILQLVHIFNSLTIRLMDIRGRVKKSLQPSFFSPHGCIYTKVAVSTSSMNLCLSCHVTWTVLHACLHYGISIKTMHFGHC